MALDYRTIDLEQPDKQFRLLHLEPASDDAEIQATLVVFDFEMCPPYAAISYTWGDQTPTLTIKINGQHFRVRMNCWYALWQMRHHSQYKYIWIDSICINQANESEKNAQVAKMGQIYRKAATTACCLGPGHSLSAAQKVARSTRRVDGGTLLTTERDALHTLQQIPYFRRIWIKQEVILSPELCLFCGVESMDWEDFEEILDSAATYDMRHASKTLEQHPRSKNLTSSVLRSLSEGRRNYQLQAETEQTQQTNDVDLKPGPWHELWQLLAQYGDAECQDPHDKVYALLGLMQPASRARLPLEVDYGAPLLDICLELIRSYITEFDITLDSQQSADLLVPVTIWQTTINMVRYWFRPQLRDPSVIDFTACWSAADAFLEANSKIAAQFEKSIGSPEYIPGDVLYQFPITGHLDDLLPILLEHDADREKLPETDLYTKSFISPLLSVGDIQSYLQPWPRRTFSRNLETPFAGVEGDFTLSALPSDMELKIVLYLAPVFVENMIFLVPASTKIGDQVLVSRLVDARLTRRFIPIVRNCDKTSTTRSAVLIGWAMQLLRDGALLQGTDLGTGSDGGSIPIREIDWDGKLAPDLEDLPPDSLFNMHYEDLVLNSILIQSPAAYLTFPCTHREHPSFFIEACEETEREEVEE